VLCPIITTSSHFLVFTFSRIYSSTLKRSCGNRNENKTDETIDDDENNRVLPGESPFLEERFIELVLVADKELFQKFNGNYEKLQEYCKDIVNIASLLYRPFNITIVLKGIVVWSEKNEKVITEDTKLVLSAFADYHEKTLMKKHVYDVALLLTGKINRKVLGRAFFDRMCSPQVSAGLVVYQDDIVTDSSTLAHEVGHVLSMDHDESGCDCADTVCVMAAQASTNLETHWSSCSVKQLERKLASGSYQCLLNEPSSMFENADFDDDVNVFGKCLYSQRL
jgi:a disintegrin and metalloproteinase with thrombospondin motifs 8